MFDALHKQLADTGTLTLAIRVRPKASATQMKSIMADGSLKIDLRAPAEDGAANAALIGFLADAFAVSPSQIEIVSGQTNRHKLVRIGRH